jgi:hypothetical protein
MVRSVEGIGWYYLEAEVLKKGERAESMLTPPYNHDGNSDICLVQSLRQSHHWSARVVLMLNGGSEWKKRKDGTTVRSVGRR